MTTTDLRPDQSHCDTQGNVVGPDTTSPQTRSHPTPRSWPSAGTKPASDHASNLNGSATTILVSTPSDAASLADPFLALAADILDDLESTRIGNENRLRQLTRTAVDADGEERGFGLDESHPDVANLSALVQMLAAAEHQAVLQLQRQMRRHPLGAWGKAQRGVGEKQLARLLAAIGDPYINTLHDRPRTVSELWAYCGYHTIIPAGHLSFDTQTSTAGGDTLAGGDQNSSGAHSSRVAARRVKGQRSNWSTAAKTRAYLIAERCMVAGDNPYRDAYDKRKANTEGRTHAAACVRCGPSGKPAQPGSSWSDGHRHADALRITSKTLLRDLWREAKRIHEEQQT